MTVKVSAKLTKDEQPYNGLDAIRQQLVDQPEGRRYGVFLFEVKKIETEIADGVQVPTVRLAHIEALEGVPADAARKLLEERYRERTGREDLQGDLFSVDGGDGERQVPEASGEEILAERRERLAEMNDAVTGQRAGGDPA